MRCIDQHLSLGPFTLDRDEGVGIPIAVPSKLFRAQRFKQSMRVFGPGATCLPTADTARCWKWQTTKTVTSKTGFVHNADQQQSAVGHAVNVGNQVGHCRTSATSAPGVIVPNGINSLAV